VSPALPATVLVVLGLATMAWWYERTRPSSRVLALVATLAALAAVGRLALAPVPNVQPTTDVVVLAGVALGAAPGFAVGAVAAVVSNVAFGQGPWTIWQMLAWGCCGVLGAGLGTVARGRVGRWSLAATCGIAGLLFGTIMNVSIWLNATDADLHGLFVVAGSSAPFDGAHALGNVAFAFAFGPAMLVAIRRARMRREGRFAPATDC
jgi:energy-coupling factor transport system substrate-specific component